MAYLNIKCGYCEQEWPIQETDDYYDEGARTCPHCGEQIDEQTWKHFIIPAFGSAADANRELYKDSTQYNKPMFSFDIKADHIYPNWKYQKLAGQIFDLKEEMAGLKEDTSDLRESTDKLSKLIAALISGIFDNKEYEQHE